jgi:hypothetical protein
MCSGIRHSRILDITLYIYAYNGPEET